jgi:hypothetical protein
MYRSARSIMAVFVLAAAAGSAAAQSRPFDLSVQAFGPTSPALRGLGEYSTGFETAEGFTVGPVAGQNGWTASVNANQTAFSVSTANPFSGSQHLRVGFDDAVPMGNTRVILGPNLGSIGEGQTVTSVMVNISSDQGSNYEVIGQAPSQELVAWRVVFNWNGGISGTPGEIFILDDPDGDGPGGLAFVDTGVVWNAGVYTELRVETDSLANTINYYYGGNLIYSSVAGMFAATSVEQFVILTDNYQNPGEVADFDNIVIAVPAPGSLALLGLGLAVGARRRRA